MVLKNRFCLAPMANFTDSAFREICLDFGADLVTTEMVSTKGLVYNSPNTFELLFSNGLENKTSVQLFGSDEASFSDAVQLPSIQKFRSIDINMGCPVPKVVKIGAGSALLNNPSQAYKIIKSAVLNTKKPVSVKFRIGWDESHIIAVDFAKMCEDAGASMITVHGRTREQMYSGKANWDIICDVAKAVKIPVIGNGDITSADETRDKIEKYSVSGVAIGRGALGNPWIFADLCGKKVTQDKFEVIKHNYDLFLKYAPVEKVVPCMRGQLNYYLKRLRIGPELRHKLNTENDLEIIYNILQKILNN